MKKLQKSGKKAPAGNKRPRRATKTLKIPKSLEKKQKKQIYWKKNKYIQKKTNILKQKQKKQTEKKQIILAIYGHVYGLNMATNLNKDPYTQSVSRSLLFREVRKVPVASTDREQEGNPLKHPPARACISDVVDTISML